MQHTVNGRLPLQSCPCSGRLLAGGLSNSRRTGALGSTSSGSSSGSGLRSGGGLHSNQLAHITLLRGGMVGKSQGPVILACAWVITAGGANSTGGEHFPRYNYTPAHCASFSPEAWRYNLPPSRRQRWHRQQLRSWQLHAAWQVRLHERWQHRHSRGWRLFRQRYQLRLELLPPLKAARVSPSSHCSSMRLI